MSLPSRDIPIGAGRMITLTTDFGLADIYAGVLHGVIAGIAPAARIIDVTHGVSPGNVTEACAKLEQAVDHFPDGVIHVAVVDPGVGTSRQALIVEADRCWFVAPDNGLLTLALRRRAARRAWAIDSRAAAGKPVSKTFHGRDLFAPAAARLAAGESPNAFAEAIPASRLAVLQGLDPLEVDEGFRIPALYADRFGNVVTGLSRETWDRAMSARGKGLALHVRVGERDISRVVETFSDVPSGAWLAYWGSGGRLEIGIRGGDARSALNGEDLDHLVAHAVQFQI